MTVEFSNSEKQLIALVLAGLWGKPVQQETFVDDVAWGELIELSLQQTVLGLMTEALGTLPATAQPSLAFKQQMITLRLQIENANRRMNLVLPELFGVLRKNHIHAWLLKGQGVGQNYLVPLSRQSGDVDILFDTTADYLKAQDIFSRFIPECGKETSRKLQEWVFRYKGVVVEFHGKIHHAAIKRKTAKMFGKWFAGIKSSEAERVWAVDNVEIPLPPYRFDALFIFMHMASHYFNSGIGLRQVCDWLRYLYVCRESIDKHILAEDLRCLGLTKVWQVFGAMAVKRLGYPAEYMPLFNERYEKEGDVVLRYILDSGNFGYHDKRTKSNSKFYYVRRYRAFVGHVQMQIRNFRMFPSESLYRLPNLLIDGLKRTRF